MWMNLKITMMSKKKCRQKDYILHKGKGSKYKRTRKGHKESFEGKGYVYYLDCGDGFIGIYRYQIYSYYTHKI